MKYKIPIILSSVVGLGLLAWILFGFFGIQALFTEKRVNEYVPLQEIENLSPVDETETSQQPLPHVVAEGLFEQGDSTYTIRGKATVTEQNGTRTLSFTDFDVTNGPDLFVYAVSSPSIDNDAVKSAVRAGSYINIGALKGNIGNQTYVLPPNLALDKHMIISIWCRRFSRNFGAVYIEQQ